MKNTRKYLTKYLFNILLIFAGIFIYFLYKNNYNLVLITKSFVVGFGISSIFFLLPMLILFFNYWFWNKSSKLDIKENAFYYQDKKQDIRFHMNDIAQVSIYMNHSRLDSFPGIFFWTQYFYSKFELKNGNVIYVSCLLNDQIESIVPKKLIKNVKKFMPLIISHDKEKIKDSKKEYKRSESLQRKQVETDRQVFELKEKFKSKTLEELDFIVSNSKSYQPQAVEAAKILIQERAQMN